MECFYLVFFTLATLLWVSSCSWKSKRWRCLILRFRHSVAHGGLHSRTVAAGSGALGKLWAPLLYVCFKEGHWRPSLVTLAWDRHDKPFGTEKKGCLQPVSLWNKSENETLGVLLETLFALFVCRRYFDLHVHCGPLSVQGRGCVIQMIIFILLNEATRMLFSPLFSSKRLLSGATCDGCKLLPLCFDVLGWTLLSLVVFFFFFFKSELHCPKPLF